MEIQNSRKNEMILVKHLRSVVVLTPVTRAATEDARKTTSR